MMHNDIIVMSPTLNLPDAFNSNVTDSIMIVMQWEVSIVETGGTERSSFCTFTTKLTTYKLQST